MTKNYWKMMLFNKHDSLEKNIMEFVPYITNKTPKQKKIKKPPVKKVVKNDGLPTI